MTITDEMALEVLTAFMNFSSKTVDCSHCGGHGTLGDDYCDMCGGSGWAIVHGEQEAMKLALEAALSPHQDGGAA